MRYAVLTSAAVLMSISSAAFAQSNPPAPSIPATNPTANTVPSASPSSKTSTSVRQQITNDLQQAGFTNIRVVADAFLVQANDKAGHPVTMFLNPGSMTVVSEVDSDGQHEDNNARGMFASVSQSDELTSKVVGLDVYNSANQKIGKIENVAFDQNKLKAYIVGVGGFMSMGEHDVAVNPSAITVSYSPSDKKWRATTDITADQLKTAPDAMRINEQASAAGMFTSIQPTDDLNSKIIGVNVYNNAKQNIGKIKDIAFNANGVKAYVLGVGGFLSLGERYVAVRPSSIALTYNASDRTWHAEMDADAGQLKAAPQYRYASNSN
jgi:sporulation protein YlmC with PRC-barrel domain